MAYLVHPLGAHTVFQRLLLWILESKPEVTKWEVGDMIRFKFSLSLGLYFVALCVETLSIPLGLLLCTYLNELAGFK